MTFFGGWQLTFTVCADEPGGQENAIVTQQFFLTYYEMRAELDRKMMKLLAERALVCGRYQEFFDEAGEPLTDDPLWWLTIDERLRNGAHVKPLFNFYLEELTFDQVIAMDEQS